MADKLNESMVAGDSDEGDRWFRAIVIAIPR